MDENKKIFDVVVFGSCIIDFISYVPRLPNAGETIHGTRFETGFGGKGANQIVAAAKLGSRTAIIGKVGDDSWGRDYIRNLDKEQVHTKFVKILKGETTGVAQINVAYTGENQIVIVVGANNHLCSDDVHKSAEVFDAGKVLICQLETPISATVTALQNFKGVSILNAAPALENIPETLLKLPTIFCVNETEAALVTGLDVRNSIDIKLVIHKLLEMGCNTVILTLGKKGAAFATRADPTPTLVKAPPCDIVIDTTGAGDAFIGALGHIYAKHPNIPLFKKIGASCEIATMSVQIAGTQKSFPCAEDVNLENLFQKEYESIILM